MNMNRKFKHVGGDAATRQRNKLLKDLQIFNSKKQTFGLPKISKSVVVSIHPDVMNHMKSMGAAPGRKESFKKSLNEEKIDLLIEDFDNQLAQWEPSWNCSERILWMVVEASRYAIANPSQSQRPDLELAVKLLVPSSIADAWKEESIKMFGVQRVLLSNGLPCPLRFEMRQTRRLCAQQAKHQLVTKLKRKMEAKLTRILLPLLLSHPP
jgi:hypothetical protein